MKTRNSIRFSLCLYLVLFEVVCQANYYQAYELMQESDSTLVYDEIIKKVEELAINYYNDGNTPGLAAAVVSDKEILWYVSLGTLHCKSQRNVDSETLFNIQSMSKSFTALAVLFAVQDGLVELDTPISEYIPGFTINSRWEESPDKLITLRHLLSHRSGIVHDVSY
jgi:CubicO group peptidase (beta-lactamase class C family)